MSWKKKTKKFLCQVVLEKTSEPAVFDEENCNTLLRREATDWLFIALGAFTHIYLAALAFIFFGQFQNELPKFTLFINTMQEPYFGALGIYVILKEIRKRRRVYPSRYWGELFVALWTIFLLVSTAFVWFFQGFGFDVVYKNILTTSLVVILIYIGSLINKP